MGEICNDGRQYDVRTLKPQRHDTYNEVREEDLHDLRLQTGSASEQLLQYGDHDMTKWRTDEGTIDGHLRHAAGEVVAVLAAVFCDPRREQLLKTRERAGGDHLGAHRVVLELFEVPLLPQRC